MARNKKQQSETFNEKYIKKIEESNDIQNILSETKPEKRLKKFCSPNFLKEIKLTEKQKEVLDIFDKNKIVIITGSAGTSKTFISIYYILKSLVEHKYENVIFTKPIQEAGENLGFLPGSIEEKIDPYYESFRQNILQMIDKQTLKKRYEDGDFQDKPLAYLRGTGFRNSILFLDEAQNCDIRSLMMFVTRMGANSKIIITGDISQHDIQKDLVALPFFTKMIQTVDGVGTFHFSESDIMREPILIEITQRYEELKSKGEIPKMKKS
jgi:phosphate starvation-inducible PhoH-like protein